MTGLDSISNDYPSVSGTLLDVVIGIGRRSNTVSADRAFRSSRNPDLGREAFERYVVSLPIYDLCRRLNYQVMEGRARQRLGQLRSLYLDVSACGNRGLAVAGILARPTQQ